MQIVKLEREMSQVQEKYKHAEEHYGSEWLNLVVAKSYLKKLIENEAVRSYVARHASEMLKQFELVLNTSAWRKWWNRLIGKMVQAPPQRQHKPN